MPGVPSHRELRRPDKSPTRHLNKDRNPPASAFDVSAGDPDDPFRPEHCPHCRINKSGIRMCGFLCPECIEELPEICTYSFRKAAAGICVNACGTLLTEKERLAQYCLCLECSEGYGREMQHMLDLRVYMEIRQRKFVDANERFAVSLQRELAMKGRCLRPRCGREMTDKDRYSTDLEWPERYVFCESCRCILDEVNPPEALRTTKVPIESLITPPMPPKPKLVGQDKTTLGKSGFPDESDIPFLDLDAINLSTDSHLSISTCKDENENENEATATTANQPGHTSTTIRSNAPPKEYNDVWTHKNLHQPHTFLLETPSVFDNLDTWATDYIRPRQIGDGFVQFANVLPENDSTTLDGQSPAYSPSLYSPEPQEPELPGTQDTPAFPENANTEFLIWMDNEAVDSLILGSPCTATTDPRILRDITEEQGSDPRAKNDPAIFLDDIKDRGMNISHLPRAPPHTRADVQAMGQSTSSTESIDIETNDNENRHPSDNYSTGFGFHTKECAHSADLHNSEDSLSPSESSSVSSSAILAMSRAQILPGNPFLADDSIDIYGIDDEKSSGPTKSNESQPMAQSSSSPEMRWVFYKHPIRNQLSNSPVSTGEKNLEDLLD